jgi:hypothetical protein
LHETSPARWQSARLTSHRSRLRAAELLIISPISASEVTLVLPTSSGTRQITYYYNNSSSSASVYSVTVLPNSLSRIDRNTNTALTLHTDLLSCTFTYYDSSGYPYTTYLNYLPGIKQISLSFTCQTGSSVNGTLTPVYRTDSAPLLLRNSALLN